MTVTEMIKELKEIESRGHGEKEVIMTTQERYPIESTIDRVGVVPEKLDKVYVVERSSSYGAVNHCDIEYIDEFE